MKQKTPAIVWIVFMLGSLCHAQTITLPKEVTGNPGSFISVPATTDGEVVKWISVTPGLNLFPIDLLKDTKTAVVMSARPGRYDVYAYTAKDSVPSDPVKTVVIIGNPPDPGPDPPGPDPEPDPDDLTELAKAVRDNARKIGNKVEADAIAENYASVISAINAGAYNSLAFKEARNKIVSDVFTMNVKITSNNEEWQPFFKELGDILMKQDADGKIKSINDIKAIFEQIQAGLEAV